MKPRPQGPAGASRPYNPSQGPMGGAPPDFEDRVAEALDHIAFVLSAIDQNVERLVAVADRLVKPRS